jgi:hypothetical protein
VVPACTTMRSNSQPATEQPALVDMPALLGDQPGTATLLQQLGSVGTGRAAGLWSLCCRTFLPNPPPAARSPASCSSMGWCCSSRGTEQ